MSISESLLPEFDQEMANTRKMLDRVPDDRFDFRPHEKSMSLGRLAGHVAELPSWATHTLQMEELRLEPGQEAYTAKSREDMLRTFDKGVAEARQLLQQATDEDLAKMWSLKFAGRTIFSLPRTAVLRGMVMNHMIHHRAQLGVYLRLSNVNIPGMYGPSADEMKFWAQQGA